MARLSSFDCRTCGLCCISLAPQQDVYADMTEEEMKKLSKSFVRRHVRKFNRIEQLLRHAPFAAIKTREITIRRGPLAGTGTCRVCTALRGSPLHRVSCSIYKNRPGACRTAIVPGDASCRTVRRLYKTIAKNAH